MTMKRNLIGLAAAISLFVSAPAFAANIVLDGNLQGACGTASATAGAATLANKCGVITTEAITAPAASQYTLTLTNTIIAATDMIVFSVGNGTNTTGIAIQGQATPGAGTATITFRHATSTNFNGTMTIQYFVFKP